MYAVGGQDGVSCLYIVEKYDPQENRWFRVASMSSRRLGVGVAVLDGYLYAIGGSDGTSPLNTVEKYDPKTNRWSPVAPMGTRRKHLGAALFQDKLYVGKILDCSLILYRFVLCNTLLTQNIVNSDKFTCVCLELAFKISKSVVQAKRTCLLRISYIGNFLFKYHLGKQFKSDLLQ